MAIQFDTRNWHPGIAADWPGDADKSYLDKSRCHSPRSKRAGDVGQIPIHWRVNEDKIIRSYEESAGLSIKGHHPKKDGILACLLAAEAVETRVASLSGQTATRKQPVGHNATGRISERLMPEMAVALLESLKQGLADIDGRLIEQVNRVGGVKVSSADRSWLLLRPSCTRPLVRFYVESESDTEMEVLLEQGRKYLLG